MKKITHLYNVMLLSVMSLVPVSAWAKINTVYDAKEEVRKIRQTIESSPVFTMISYTVGAIGIFVALVVIVILLFTILRR